MIKLRPILLLPLLLLIAGCGFHLRGTQPGAASITSISVDDLSASGVGNEVRALLEASGTTVDPENTASAWRLNLREQLLDKSVLSVSPVTGKVEEYQLTLTVRMSVIDAGNTELLAGQAIRVSRDYAFDDEAVLGSVSEQRVLEQEMIRQAASQVVRRLDALARRQQ